MKITPLALVTIFVTATAAFGLNGAPKTFATTKSTKHGLGFAKAPLVQPVDVQGNRINHNGVVSFPTAVEKRSDRVRDLHFCDYLGCVVLVLFRVCTSHKLKLRE